MSRLRTALDVLTTAFLCWVASVLVVGVVVNEDGTAGGLLSLGAQLAAITFGARAGWQFSRREKSPPTPAP